MWSQEDYIVIKRGDACSKTADENRNCGIDLLRLLLMFMVCMIHVLQQGGVLDACTPHSLEYNVYWFMKVASYCAVDAFAFISGYVAKNKKHAYSKIVNMWFQVMFYSVGLTSILILCGVNNSLDLKGIIRCILPVTFNRYWYFTAYFGLFFVTPMLNKYLFALDVRTAKKTFILLLVLFSCLGVLGDPFKSASGFSCLWLIVVYILGILAKRINLFSDKTNFKLGFIWILTVLLTWVVVAFWGIQRIMYYISPTILLCGMILVIMFERIKISDRHKKIIKKLAPLTFGIFLFQLNPIIYSDVLYNKFSFVPNVNIIFGIMCVVIGATMIFVIGLVMESIRVKIYTFLSVNKLSCKIVKLVDNYLETVGNILN